MGQPGAPSGSPTTSTREGEETPEGRPDVAATAIEALGGTPPGLRRDPVSPLRPLLPESLERRLAAFDQHAERLFDHLRGRPLVDRLFYSASSLADFSLLWHLLATARGLRGTRRQGEAARLGVALGIESVMVNVGIKSLFRRSRPRRQEHERHQLRLPRSSSFPSGHATSGFMAAGLLSEHRPAWQFAGWHLLASVVAASRIHVGIHHASDVVAGAAMGAGFARLVRRAWPLRADAAGRRS
ncbi:MAG TPA: phosphatase PAP2 family protein [Acidimicrobiales bacterium]|nr:phosphatase PAP2 family protein [Acidimicrobiales bacterium]